MKNFLIALFLLLATSLFSENLHFQQGLWPIYFKEDKTENFLVPFFQFNGGIVSKFIFRPFFLYQKRNNGNYQFNLLYPIVEFSKNNKVVTERIFPFFNKKYEENRSDEYFSHFFPVFWGKYNNKKYGGVFPIYGKLINKFHYNEINFYLWPLYFSKRKGEDIDYNFLWPFFGYGKGEDYSALRVWPFFGYKEKKNYFSRKFFLWPFFIFQKRKIELSDNGWEYSNIYFPFYIHTFSKYYNYKTFLFPFFRINKRGEDYRYYAFPWPFFTYEKDGKGFYDIAVFPFIHIVHKTQYDRLSFLWVLFRNEKIFTKNRRELIEENRSFLLINRFEKDYEHHVTYKNIWPFFEYYRKNDNYILKIFELFPFKIPEVYELYSPFFNIFYIAKKDGRKKISFLWGLLSYEKNKKNSCFNFLKILKFCTSNKKIVSFNKERWELICNTGM